MSPSVSPRSWSNTAPRLLALMVNGSTPDIDDSFTRIDDALFNLAQSQGSNGGVLMDGLRLMRANRSSLVAEWGDLIRQGIEDWGQSKPALTSSGLSLVDDDDLERSLAIDQMAEVFAKTHEREFSHLNQAWMAIAEALTAENLERSEAEARKQQELTDQAAAKAAKGKKDRKDSRKKDDIKKDGAESGAVPAEGATVEVATGAGARLEAIMVTDCPAHPHGLAVLVGRLVDKLNLNLDARLTVLKTFERSLGSSLDKMLPEIIALMVEDGWVERRYIPAVNEQRQGQPRTDKEAGANAEKAGQDRGRDEYDEREEWDDDHAPTDVDDPRGQKRWGGDRRRPGGSRPRYGGTDRRAPGRPYTEQPFGDGDIIGPGPMDGDLMDGGDGDGRFEDGSNEGGVPLDSGAYTGFSRDARYPVAPRGWMEQNRAYGFTPYGFAPYGFSGENRSEDPIGRRISNRHGYDQPQYERADTPRVDGSPEASFAAGSKTATRKQLANDLTLALSRLLGSAAADDDLEANGTDGQAEIDPDQIDPAAAQLVALLQRRRAVERPSTDANGIAVEGEEGGVLSLNGHASAPISATAIRSVLDVLQRDMPEPVRHAARANDSSLAQQFKDEMLLKATEIGVAEENSHLEERDEDAVDVVGMLFEVFLSERAMTEDTREHIARLVAPYVKAALSDRKLFLQRTHPARRLLDSLAEACDGNMGSTTQERDILSRVARAIDEVVRAYNEDEAIFSEAEKEIRDFITSQRRVSHLAEQRAEQALKGKERLEEAKTDSQAFFEKTLGDRNWPVRTLELLRSYWCQHHTMTLLRNEPGAAEIDASKRLLGGLIDVGTRGVQKAADHVRALHADVITMLGSSGLMDQSAVDAAINLWGTLDQAGQWTALAKARGSVAAHRAIPEPPKVEPTDTAVAFALFQTKKAEETQRQEQAERVRLSKAANKTASEAQVGGVQDNKSLESRPDATVSLTGVPASGADIIHAVVGEAGAGTEAGNGRTAGKDGPEDSSKDATDPSQDQPTLDALTDYFDNMPIGAWVDFIDEYGRSTASKLSWISPISRKRLFVTVRGLRHATETPDDLAMMVAMKRLQIRDVGVGEHGFDHSYRKALEELDLRVSAVA